MELLIFIIGLLTFIHLLSTAIECSWGFCKIKSLSTQAELPTNKLPSVTIILSALNEEKALEPALNSLLECQYPDFEVIAINDRSTDTTPQILENVKNKTARLKVFHIHNLPEGWLGKNHAMHFASKRAYGDWLLFTDADVIMQPDALVKAMSYALQHEIDHLTIYEHHVRKSFWLKVLMLGSYASYIMVMKPWRISFTWSKKYLGHGAFNLVKKSAYLNSGGHLAIAMACLDDLMLGKLLKQNGYRQDIVDGNCLIAREWYDSAKAMIKGLKKNSFAYFNFSLRAVCRDFTFALIYYIWPLIAIFALSGPSKWINIINVSLTIAVSATVAKQFRLHQGFAFLYPISILMLLYTIWLSVFSTYKNNGVIWRETHYSLEKLKHKK